MPLKIHTFLRSPRLSNFVSCFALILLSVSLNPFLRAQVYQEMLITVSDGIQLDATMLQPLGFPPSGGFPGIVLVHGYGGNKTHMQELSILLAVYGYASIAYSVRGQGNSGGFSTTLGIREREDLREVIHVFRNASNIHPEKIGVTGGSQGGIHSWMAAIDRIPGVKAVVPLIATPNFARDLVPNGCMRQGLVHEITLSDVRYAPERDRIRAFIIADNYDSVRTFIDARNLAHLVDSVRIPVLQGLGWADFLFPVNSGIDAAARLASRGVPIWSYYGTNGHGEPVDTAEALFLASKLVAWFDHWLKGFSLDQDSVPVVFYADDRPGWPRRTTNTWPPQPFNLMRLYLTGTGLAAQLPSSNDTARFSLTYNPAYTPTMGWDDRYGGSSFLSAFASSPARFVSPPLNQQIEVTGIPRVRLHVASDASKFQVHARLYDVSTVDTGQVWRLMTRGAYGVRDNASGLLHEVEYECNALSHVIPAGNMIGLEITSLDLRTSDRANIIPYFSSSNSIIVSSPTEPSYAEIPIVGPVPTPAPEFSSPPKHFALSQNYPNPFNPNTTIEFDLPYASFVRLKVYDLLGREVAAMVNQQLEAGRHSRVWNAGRVTSGVYLFRLEADKFIATKKMLLIK